MYNLCTYFDKNYLAQGLTLYRSLSRQQSKFLLWILCFDDTTFSILEKLNLSSVKLLRESDITMFDNRLLEAKSDRPLIQYYYCFTAALINYVFHVHTETGSVTYIDADMVVYTSLSEIIHEEDRDISIIEHHLQNANPKNYHGKFNVSIIYFKRSENALSCLKWWGDMTLVSTKLGDGVWGDQMYLDEFPEKFKDVHIISDVSIGAAPWNVELYGVTRGEGKVMINGTCLKVFHFARFIMLNRYFFVPIKRAFLSKQTLKQVYLPYMMEMRESYDTIKRLNKKYKLGYTLRNLRGALLGILLGRCFLLTSKRFFRIGIHIPLGYEKF